MLEPLGRRVRRTLAHNRLSAPLVSFMSKLREDLHGRKMVRFYSQFVKSGSLCYDVGANIGNRTQIFRRLGARVIAVEPQTACVRVLRERFNSDAGVVIVPLGVSSARGSASLALSDNSTTIASFSPDFRREWRWSGQVEWKAAELVELTTLDDLIREFGVPNFCKIDVEGFEEQVLLGLSQPIPGLSFEFNIELMTQTRRCVERLRVLGYRNFNYSAGESMCLHLSEWIDGGRLVELLMSQTDPLFWGDVYVLK
jgi:FkbM family methyltransferase